MPKQRPPLRGADDRGAVPPPASRSSARRFGVRAGLFALLLALGALAVLLSTRGTGRRIPLPRGEGVLVLGTSRSEVLAAFPGRKPRPFNQDPAFDILTLEGNLPLGASQAEVLFHRDRLYFVSLYWEGEAAEALPFKRWIQEARPWRQGNGGENVLGAGEDVQLQEWTFADGATEAVFRELRANGTLRRWRDLRDASNGPAQTDFAKHRIDAPP